MKLKRIFKKLKRVFMRGLALVAVYAFAIICVLMMADRVERLEEKERLQNECNVAVKIDK